MTAHEAIELVTEAAVDCLTRTNKPPTKAFVGPDAWAAILKYLANTARWTDRPMRGLIFHTPAGQVSLGVRQTLYRHVIVEGDDGEPFIQP